MSGLDEAWRNLELDALASDGPIRDRDVKDAISRNRPRIERDARAPLEARVAALEGLLRVAEMLALAVQEDTDSTRLLLDALQLEESIRAALADAGTEEVGRGR